MSMNFIHRHWNNVEWFNSFWTETNASEFQIVNSMTADDLITLDFDSFPWDIALPGKVEPDAPFTNID